MVGEAAYSGSAGVKLLDPSLDHNALTPAQRALGSTVLNTQVANPFLALPADQQPPAASIIGATKVSVAQLLRPMPQFGQVTSLFDNGAHSTYHSLQLRLEKRFSSNLSFQASYTFSKLLDDASAIQTNSGVQVTNFQDPYNRRLDKAPSTFDARNRLVIAGSYALPFGTNQRFLNSHRWMDLTAGGWTLDSILSYQTGFPLAITATALSGQTGLAFGDLRPNLVGDPQGPKTIDEWFNTDAFAPPASFSTGNAPRTFANLRAPNSVDWNLAIHKNFSIAEHLRAQLRLEAFNVLNRANFRAPGTVLGSAGFGVINSTGDPREVQIAARVYF